MKKNQIFTLSSGRSTVEQVIIRGYTAILRLVSEDIEQGCIPIPQSSKVATPIRAANSKTVKL